MSKFTSVVLFLIPKLDYGFGFVLNKINNFFTGLTFNVAKKNKLQSNLQFLQTES